MMSSRASDPTFGGCASTNPMLSRPMASWSLFLLLGVFVPTASHFILSCAPTHYVYDVVVQLSLTFATNLSYLCPSAFVRHYDLHRFLFLDKINFFFKLKLHMSLY
ncbi:hypothetical protein GW17_00005014 [Ensete ventricosum]|nr:hypothetical protein GW17_00005014 [Ensete ventricosum]